MQDSLDIRSTVERWTKDKMYFSSSFYTGRGVTSSDLNSEILEDMYCGIKADIGPKEARNFAKFVANLKDLSASAFIQAFEVFWKEGCSQPMIAQAPRSGYKSTGVIENEILGEVFVLTGHAFSGRVQTQAQVEADSRSLKAEFVAKHAAEIRS